MKNAKKYNNVSNKAQFKPRSKKRQNKCIVTFDDNDRQDYLTGFHKRKVERRKVALAEIQRKLKEEQIRVREERHKEYIKMLKERTEALADAEDDLEDVITSKTESVQYDHPNHTVTVTTISDLDLTGAHLLQPAATRVNGDEGEEKGEEEKEEKEKTDAMPRRARNTITNKKIRSLTASLSTFTSKRKKKGQQEGRGTRGQQTDKRRATEKKKQGGKTCRWQRRRNTGKRVKYQD